MPVARIYRVGAPFNSSELNLLNYEQTVDVVYFAHENHAPQKLIRHDHALWEFLSVTFGPTISTPSGVGGTATVDNTDAANSGNAYFPQPASYKVTAFNDETGQESRASTVVTLTNDLSLKRNYNTIHWSAVSGATSYLIYKSENQQSYGNIGTTDQLTFRDDNIDPDLSAGPPVGDNPFEAEGDRPSSITFHEQRSWWGRSINKPNGLWASRSADYENMDFTRPGREDDSIVLGLVANQVNSVNNLVSTKQGLLALTGNNIFGVQGSNEDYITATPPPRVRPEISRGASRLKPLTIDGTTFYETAKTGEVRTIGFQFEVDGIRSNDVSLFSRHLFEGFEIVSWCYAEKPASAIWAVRDDGSLLCMTWDEAQEVWGWTLCTTDGSFKGCCVITEQDEDRVYFLVERTINGDTKLYVERMASELWEDQEDACYLDCARTFTADDTQAEFDRLDHLEGKTVSAWVDGSEITTDHEGNPLVVTDGAITLSTGGLKVTVGLPFTAEVETLPLAMQIGAAGWSVARPQQAAFALLKVVETRNVVAGVDSTQLFPVKQRQSEDYVDPIVLFTGYMEVSLGGTSGEETSVTIQSPGPEPFHLAAVLVEPKIADLN